MTIIFCIIKTIQVKSARQIFYELSMVIVNQIEFIENVSGLSYDSSHLKQIEPPVGNDNYTVNSIRDATIWFAYGSMVKEKGWN